MTTVLTTNTSIIFTWYKIIFFIIKLLDNWWFSYILVCKFIEFEIYKLVIQLHFNWM